ncbi:sel1 repeat family protein [Oxalobacteraceae bacterium]|nr:sel1 repeat family protein [Oxalobacteraceae bacterium]
MQRASPVQLARGAVLVGAVLAVLSLQTACQSHDSAPGSAQIAAMSARASEHDAAAERQLREWARQGLPVAERELGLLYRDRVERHEESVALFEAAARSGDAEAAFQLGELHRSALPGQSQAPRLAAPWYRMAALQHHARAALALALLYRNGEGVARDDEQAATWLTRASDLGDGHAMFLLADSYTEGRGVVRDSAKGRALLEEAAEREYAPAQQALGRTLQGGDALSRPDPQRAGLLLRQAVAGVTPSN